MKNKFAKLWAVLAAAALITTLVSGCQPEGEPQDTPSATGSADAQVQFTTRAIRTSTKGADILPVPEKYVTEKEGDQARFDSYVWLAQKLKENYDGVVVLDARTQSEYNKEHLPGAVQAHWQDWSNMDVSQDSGEWSLVFSTQVIAEKLAALGIDGKKPVVVYNDPLNGSGEEGHQLWVLRLYGLTDSYILNGGIAAWKAAGYETTKDKPAITPVEKPTLTRNEALFASTDYVKENLDSDNILDSRSDQEYAGQKNNGEKSKGRIPGAAHVWFKDFYRSDGTLLTPAEIRARVEPLGFATDKPVVAYCTGGIRSAITAVVLEIGGYENVRNYDASFSGWAGTDQTVDSNVYSELSVVNN